MSFGTLFNSIHFFFFVKEAHAIYCDTWGLSELQSAKLALISSVLVETRYPTSVYRLHQAPILHISNVSYYLNLPFVFVSTSNRHNYIILRLDQAVIRVMARGQTVCIVGLLADEKCTSL